MQFREIKALALKAQYGDALAMRNFKLLAKAEGFTGRAGGWIYYRDSMAATTQGWAALASMVANGRIRFSFAESRRGGLKEATAAMKPLSATMRELVKVLEYHGNVDPIRDGRRVASTTTIVALMDRGIIREAKGRSGIHWPATFPAQVEADAHAENDRRDAEAKAAQADPESWAQVDEDGDVRHMRMTRTGGQLYIRETARQHWLITLDGNVLASAGGTFEEARAAADRFERSHDHDQAAAQEEADEVARQNTRQARREDSRRKVAMARQHPETLIGTLGGPEMGAAVIADLIERDHASAIAEAPTTEADVFKSIGWGRDLPGEVTLYPGVGERPLESGRLLTIADMREHAADLLDSLHAEAVAEDEGEGWGQPDGMLGATEAELMTAEERDQHSSDYWEATTEGMPRVPAFTPPASAAEQLCEHGARNWAATDALISVGALREMAKYPGLPVTAEWMTRHLDAIEAALRADR
jgi:hypothetical protein